MEYYGFTNLSQEEINSALIRAGFTRKGKIFTHNKYQYTSAEVNENFHPHYQYRTEILFVGLTRINLKEVLRSVRTQISDMVVFNMLSQQVY